MIQLTFFDKWYDHYIGLEMYSDIFSSRLIIKNILINYDPYYKFIAIEFYGVVAKQLFSDKDHFENYFNIHEQLHNKTYIAPKIVYV